MLALHRGFSIKSAAGPHKLSKHWELVAVKFSACASPPPRLRDHHRRGSRKNVKAREWDGGVDHHLPVSTPVTTCTGDLFKIGPTSISSPGEERFSRAHAFLKTYIQLKVAGGWERKRQAWDMEGKRYENRKRTLEKERGIRNKTGQEKVMQWIMINIYKCRKML